MNGRPLRNRLTLLGWRPLLVRGLVLAAGWWIISEGDAAGLAFGVPMVALALCASALLPSLPPPRWSAIGLAGFVAAFLVGSLTGGIDVARRALSPRLSLAPVVIRYRLRLATEPGRHLFMLTLSLLPGTLSVALDGDVLELHVLFDRGDAVVLQLRKLETRVAHAARDEVPDA